MYSSEQKKILLDVARQSIRYGLDHRASLPIDINSYEKELQARRATFITLKKDGELRGCIGMLEAMRPLVTDVSENAYAAAYRDGRFPQMTGPEIDQLSISISVLSPSEPIDFASEEDLLSKIRPGVDGLILEDGYHRGTFLPSVWEQVQNPRDFLVHLKLKAGLHADYWSDSMRIKRYTTEYIEGA